MRAVREVSTVESTAGRVVAVVDGLDREPPDAGPRKDRLRHHGAAEERAELQPRDGDDGDRGVLEGVLGHHEELREPLGPGRPDIVGAQHLEDGRARGPGHRRRMNRMPMKKVGADWPTRATPMVAWSSSEFRRTADRRPTGTATSTASVKAVRPRSRVAGR